MAKHTRKKGEEALLLALACGATVEAAAKQCGMSDRTVSRRLQDSEFVAQLRAHRSDMVRRSAGMLTAAAGEAVRTLLALQKEGAPPAVRLGAARAVLEIGIKVREMAELQADMREMEEKIKALAERPPDTGRREYPPVVPLVGGDADPNAI